MIALSKQQILNLHFHLIEETGGIQGLRDEGALESAMASPFQTFANTDFYPTVLKKAVRLGYGLIKNHPFLDGNKRIGAQAMLVLLDLNNIDFIFKQEEMTKIVLEVADGKCSYEKFLSWSADCMNKGKQPYHKQHSISKENHDDMER